MCPGVLRTVIAAGFSYASGSDGRNRFRFPGVCRHYVVSIGSRFAGRYCLKRYQSADDRLAVRHICPVRRLVKRLWPPELPLSPFLFSLKSDSTNISKAFLQRCYNIRDSKDSQSFPFALFRQVFLPFDNYASRRMRRTFTPPHRRSTRSYRRTGVRLRSEPASRANSNPY